MEERNYFIVAEIQSGDNVAVITTTHNGWNDALQKFYQTMVSAVASNVPEHTVLIMDKVGQVRKIETVYHYGVANNE